MSSLTLVKYPSSFLKQQAEAISKVDANIENLVERMFETMFASDGVGLAAPQIGESKRLFIAAPEGIRGPRFTYINPELISGSGTEKGPEGCLSFPGVFGEVERFKEIKVRYTDLQGEIREKQLKGFVARIFQHEKDHLDGVLFVEHLGFNERKAVLDEYKRLQQITL